MLSMKLLLLHPHLIVLLSFLNLQIIFRRILFLLRLIVMGCIYLMILKTVFKIIHMFLEVMNNMLYVIVIFFMLFKETQASQLGDAPVHPLLHQQSSVHRSPHYIFITSYVMCYAWSVSLFNFCLVLVLFVVHNKLDPSIPCLGEKHAPLSPRMLIIFMLIFVECSLFFLTAVMFSSCFHVYH